MLQVVCSHHSWNVYPYNMIISPLTEPKWMSNQTLFEYIACRVFWAYSGHILHIHVLLIQLTFFVKTPNVLHKPIKRVDHRLEYQLPFWNELEKNWDDLHETRGSIRFQIFSLKFQIKKNSIITRYSIFFEKLIHLERFNSNHSQSHPWKCAKGLEYKTCENDCNRLDLLNWNYRIFFLAD